jgi:hypothetical protein
MIAKPKIEFREEVLQGICRLGGFDFEVVQFTYEMLIYPGFHLLAK